MTTASEHPPVTLVWGAESLLADRAVADLVRRARQVDPDVDVSVVSAADTAAGALAELLSPSLFAATRVAVITDIDDAADDLGAALEAVAVDPPPDCTLVLVHPGGTKGKRLVEALRRAGVHEERCEPIKRAEDVLDFVVREVRRNRGQIDQQAAARLVEVLGSDLRALASMAEQLVADSDGTVTVALVAAYVEGRADVKGWTIADHTVTGQVDRALSELRWALSTGTDPVLVVGALAASLRTLARLSAIPRGYRDVDVARDLGVPTWKVRVLRSQLHGWSPPRLAQALLGVARADLDIKGGSSDHTLALSRAVLTVADARG
jgi:DNA polymerase III subunit delta